MLKMNRMRFPKAILMCIRWYAAYALSYRNLEEMTQERGVVVDHTTINLWAIRFLPMLEKIFRRHKWPVGGRWRMDETHISRCVGIGNTCTVRLIRKVARSRAKRDKAAATWFFRKAMGQNGNPAKVTMEKSGANKAAMGGINKAREAQIAVRQIKYLNNIVEQDHHAVKRIMKPMMGFKSFRTAYNVLASIELMHMIREGQMIVTKGDELSFADASLSLCCALLLVGWLTLL